MQRSVIAIGAGLCVALAGVSGWLLLDRNAAQQDLARVRTATERATEALLDAQDELETLDGELDDQRQATKRWRSRAKDLRPRLLVQKLRSRQLRDLFGALAPPRSRLGQTRLVAGPDRDLLIVEWNQERVSGEALPRSGLQVWSLMGRPTAAATWRASDWQLIYAMGPDPGAGVMLVGPPDAQLRESSDASSAWLAAVGDVTGDGMPDLAIQQWNSGSGGCGVVRVLENSTSGLNEIFRRDDCDHSISLGQGLLEYTTAIWPKGCRTAHGCGSKDVMMRWNGIGWETVDVARSVYER